MNDFEQRTSDYLEGVLSEAEREEFISMLETDPELRRHFARLVRDHRMLSVYLANEPVGAFAEMVERILDSEQPPRRDDLKICARPAPKKSLKLNHWAGLAAAAAVMLFLGYGLYSARRTTTGAIAKVVSCEGFGVRESATTGQTGIQAGAALAIGDRLVVSKGGAAQVRFSDGTLMDLNENTALRFGGKMAGQLVAVEHGQVYCSVKTRAPGSQPFVMGTAAGHAVKVMGTRFELGVQGVETVVKVEEGKVRLSTRQASREATELTQLRASGNSVSEPEAIALYDLATWKFRQADVPAGTILFEDHFENGLDKWDIVYGEAEIKKDKSGNGFLQMRWKKDARGAVFPRFICRHKKVEVIYTIRMTKRGSIIYGTHTGVYGKAARKMKTELLLSKSYSGIPVNQWLDHKSTIEGLEIHEILMKGKKPLLEAKKRIPKPFTALGIYADQAGGFTLDIKQVVVKKLAD